MRLQKLGRRTAMNVRCKL